MATGWSINNKPVEAIFGSKGAHTAQTTGYQSNSVDLNQSLLALQDGVSVGFATGMEVASNDFENIFGTPSGNTSLPINGQTFNGAPTQAGGFSTCQMYFNSTSSSWSVTGTQSNTSGNVPSGAASLSVQFTYVSGSTGAQVNNLAKTNLSGTTINGNVKLTSSQSSPITANYSVSIVFYDSSGNAISTTTCNFFLVTSAV
jgi:hypothetical protein